jgi:hypothetical protein
MKPKHETRAVAGIERREAPKDSGFIATLTGYAAVFNSDSLPITNERRGRPFVERVAPGAFAETLTEKRNGDEILSFWAHMPEQPLGRFGKNLRLSEDERGLRYELDVPDTTAGRDLVENIKHGIVDGVSFGFSVRQEKFVRGAEMDTRTLVKVKLYEVSPTAIPAYPDTSIDFRSHDELCAQPAEVRAVNIGDDGKKSFDRDEPAATAKTPNRDLWAARLGIRS